MGKKPYEEKIWGMGGEGGSISPEEEKEEGPEGSTGNKSPGPIPRLGASREGAFRLQPPGAHARPSRGSSGTSSEGERPWRQKGGEGRADREQAPGPWGGGGSPAPRGRRAAPFLIGKSLGEGREVLLWERDSPGRPCPAHRKTPRQLNPSSPRGAALGFVWRRWRQRFPGQDGGGAHCPCASSARHDGSCSPRALIPSFSHSVSEEMEEAGAKMARGKCAAHAQRRGALLGDVVRCAFVYEVGSGADCPAIALQADTGSERGQKAARVAL